MIEAMTESYHRDNTGLEAEAPIEHADGRWIAGPAYRRPDSVQIAPITALAP